MICVSIGNFGLDACRKALKRCEKYRRQFAYATHIEYSQIMDVLKMLVT